MSTIPETDLFSPVVVGPYTLSNRIVMAPLTRARSPENIATPMMQEYYAQRASAGLIISEGVNISPQATGYAFTPGIWTDEQIESWRPVTAGVHDKGGRIFAQLWHVGRVSHPDVQAGGILPVAPSAVRPEVDAFTPDGKKPALTPRALALEELPEIVADYAQATRNALAAGFDGVEIHAANGYLLDQFMRDGANQRTDDYGGSVENRIRLTLEVTKAGEWAKLGGRRGRIRFRNKAGPTMDVSIFVETTFDDGETKRRNLGRLRRAPDEFGSENVGLLLDDAKTLLRRLQEAIVQDQVGEAIEARRKCDGCGKHRAIHDDRGRILDTLFGRIRVKWPRLRRCLCQPAGIAKAGPQSPFVGLFSDRATPELRRLQAELGAKHSFREAARLIEMFLPCSAQLNTTVRNRLGRIADELGHVDANQGDADTIAPPAPLTVFLDGAHIRCRPEYQKRHLDVVVGKVESPNMSRRFGLVQQAARSPAKLLRHDLIAQGWDGQSKVTVISDGEPALPNLVRRAVRGPVTHILDWWHISMRVKHIENAVRGLLQSKEFSGLPLLFERPADTLRWYLWHGKVMTAATILKVLQIDCDRLHAESRESLEAAKRVRARCQDLYSYLANNFDALVDYGHRHRTGLAVSSSRAEGCVDDIGNTRMGKRRRMRWSPRGAHRVAVTRAAVLDGRLGVSKRAA